MEKRAHVGRVHHGMQSENDRMETGVSPQSVDGIYCVKNYNLDRSRMRKSLSLCTYVHVHTGESCIGIGRQSRKS